MNKRDAAEQINGFARRIGRADAANDSAGPLQVRLGESVIGLEFDDQTGAIAARALIYRFRKAPAEKTLASIIAFGNPDNTGGGNLIYDASATTLFLERRFPERTDDRDFYDDINRLAQASILWSTKLLADAAEISAGR